MPLTIDRQKAAGLTNNEFPRGEFPRLMDQMKTQKCLTDNDLVTVM
jgi:hypothetical protein